MEFRSYIIPAFTLITLLSACSGGGDWPNLSDPLPDPKDRERQIERSDTPAPDAVYVPPQNRPAMTGSAPDAPAGDPMPSTIEEATALLQTIKKALREETLAYRKAKAKIVESEGENMQDAWFAAQLALTRLSNTASRLDTLLALEMPDIIAAATSESEVLDTFVVNERQKLFESKP